MGDITRNFSYDEFKVSKAYPQVAAAIELTELDRYKFFWLSHLFLQPIRDAVQFQVGEEIPITVSSCIRRGELNGLVGGVPNSDHCFNKFSGAVDFIIGDYGNRLTGKYYDVIRRVCERKKDYVKQLIYYYPHYEGENTHGDFMHLSLRDKTTRVWERLWCVNREGRTYFPSKQQAEDYIRANE